MNVVEACGVLEYLGRFEEISGVEQSSDQSVEKS